MMKACESKIANRDVKVAWGLMLLLVSCSAEAAVDNRKDVSDYLEEGLRQELQKKFPAARVELSSLPRFMRGRLPSEVRRVTVLSTTAQGEAYFTVDSETPAVAQGAVMFSAMMSARVAVRRIFPGESLKAEDFATQEINVASGANFELRGVVLSQEQPLAKLETRQTILEGQVLLSSAVQRMPDIRRGDSIQVRVVSGDLRLMTTGQALEPGYLNQSLKITAGKKKNELQGKLLGGGVVEVKL